KKAETIKQGQAAEAERATRQAEIAAAVKEALKPAPKTAAELAAERALAEATRVKMPDSKLLIEDPDKFNAQLADYIKQGNEESARPAKEEALAEVRQTMHVEAADREQVARQMLRKEFFDKYPSLQENAASIEVVESVMAAKIDELKKSGRLDKKMTAEEQM